MVTSKRQIKVADFGIARSVSDSMSRVTANQGSSGTLVYMSPQQLAGIPSKPTDDVYALGATIYELLAGRPPFYTGDIPYQIREVKPPTVAERREELEIEAEPIPEQWEQTIAACLAKDPADRPQSAGAVAISLGLTPATEAATASTPAMPLPKTDSYPPPPGPASRTAQTASKAPTNPPTGGTRQTTTVVFPPPPPPDASLNLDAVVPPPAPKTLRIEAPVPEKKSNAGLIVAGAVVLFLLVCMIGAVAFFMGRHEPTGAITPTTTGPSNVVQTAVSEDAAKLAEAAKTLAAAQQKLDEETKAEAARVKALQEEQARADAARLKAQQDDQAKADAQVKAEAERQRVLAAQEAANADLEKKARLELQAMRQADEDKSRAPATFTVPAQYITIQMAINAAHSGDMVQVSGGTYEEMIQFKSGVKLLGEGMDTVTVRCAATAGSTLTARGCASGAISGITFEHTGSDNSADRHPAVVLLDSNVEMSRCVVRNSGGNGLVINGGADTVHDCTFKSNARSGIFVGNKAAPSLRDNQVFNNVGNGITFMSGATGVTEGSASHNNEEDGFYVSGPGTSPVLRKNRGAGNAKMGIGVNDHANVVLEGNTCEDNGWSGIGVLTSASATLTANQCIKNKQHGIIFSSGGNGQLEKNNCLQNTWCGIFLDGPETTTRLVDNQCNYNMRYGIRSVNGANSDIDVRNLATGNKLGQIQK
jgi:parallel beta-helix repeat protein